MSDRPKHKPCFGRREDLDSLWTRVQQRGVTFIMAPPRMGKTWLVRNLAFARAEHEGWSVGYAESSSGKNDLLREAIKDLYTAWFDSSTFRQQAASLLHHHKDRLVTRVGGVLARVLNKVGEVTNRVATPGSHLVRALFDGLAELDKDLRSGSLAMHPITYDDAHAFVSLVADLREKPVLLVMDAWERGDTLAGDRGSIQKLLDNIDSWPDSFHLLVVIRDHPKHLPEVRFADDSCRDHPAAKSSTVTSLALADLGEQDVLLKYLGSEVPGIAHADPAWVVEQCTTPAVIEWWVREKPQDLSSLKSLAADARKNRYDGLIHLIEGLRTEPNGDKLLTLTTQLALLPEITTEEMWSPYRDLLAGESCDSHIADLQSRRILDPNQPDFPTFGHTTAYESVRAYFLSDPGPARHDPRPKTREVLKNLTRRTCARVSRIDPTDMPYSLALIPLAFAAKVVRLPVIWQFPGELAATLFSSEMSTEIASSILKNSPTIRRDLLEASALLGSAMVNAINHFGTARQFDDLERCLTELQTIHDQGDHPEVHFGYSKALFNAIYDYGTAQRFDDLEGCLKKFLALRDQDDRPEIRLELAEALFNAISDYGKAQRFDDLERCLKELLPLCDQDDRPETRAHLAKALVNAISFYIDINKLDQTDPLLDDLQKLFDKTQDSAILDPLGRAHLFIAAALARSGDDASAEPHFLDVRSLGRRSPELYAYLSEKFPAFIQDLPPPPRN